MAESVDAPAIGRDSANAPSLDVPGPERMDSPEQGTACVNTEASYDSSKNAAV